MVVAVSLVTPLAWGRPGSQMAYSTTRTTTGSRLCRSLAAYSRDSHDPSARTWSTGSVGAVLPVLARHNSSAPVAAAVRHSLAPTNNRSPNSRPASVVSPVAYDPIAALIVAWVPHSTSPTTRTCGNAPVPSPRPLLARPNAASLSAVSATSSVAPSTASSRHRRYHAPGVSGVASGRAALANSTCSGSGPSRARAC